MLPLNETENNILWMHQSARKMWNMILYKGNCNPTFQNRNLISRLFSSCLKALINHKWLDSLIWNINTCFLYQINISILFGSLFVHTELKQMRMSHRWQSMGSKCVRSIHIYSVTTLAVSRTRTGTGSRTHIMQKPFTLAVSEIRTGHLKVIEITHHLKEFQDLKNG